MDRKLLDILVCPICKSDLDLQSEKSELACKPCKLAFPIKDGIPIMLEEEARQILVD
ncbi:MAG: Trm112 family protein [Burkholderiales bacterium]|nr:Trm112 family protein [Burkholderiales bacterium]OUT78773.1 MAG: tetraacyldisaccharide 4'-kinase [Betaproteobacteria bacterium TMED22]